MIEDLSLTGELLQRMRHQAERLYPEECCGFLVGVDEGASRTITRVEPIANRVGSERERRYVIPPEALRMLEAELDGTPSKVVGFYHSHPDHPAQPSTFDRDHAWPWYTYLVLGVTESGVHAWGAFELDEDSGEFREVDVAAPRVIRERASNGGVSESS